MQQDGAPALMILGLWFYFSVGLFIRNVFLNCIYESLGYYIFSYCAFFGINRYLFPRAGFWGSQAFYYSLCGMLLLSIFQIRRWRCYRTPRRFSSAIPLMLLLLLWSGWVAVRDILFLFWLLALLGVMVFLYWKQYKGAVDERPFFLKFLTGLWAIMNLHSFGFYKCFNFALGWVFFFLISLLRKRIQEGIYLRKEEKNEAGSVEATAMWTFSIFQVFIVFAAILLDANGARYAPAPEFCALFFAILPLIASEFMLDLLDELNQFDKKYIAEG